MGVVCVFYRLRYVSEIEANIVLHGHVRMHVLCARSGGRVCVFYRLRYVSEIEANIVFKGHVVMHVLNLGSRAFVNANVIASIAFKREGAIERGRA